MHSWAEITGKLRTLIEFSSTIYLKIVIFRISVPTSPIAEISSHPSVQLPIATICELGEFSWPHLSVFIYLILLINSRNDHEDQ